MEKQLLPLKIEELEKKFKAFTECFRIVKKYSLNQNISSLEKLKEFNKLISKFDLIEKEIPNFQAYKSELEMFKENIVKSLENEKQTFGHKLNEELIKRGLSIEGQYPKFKVGLITLEVLYENNMVKLWYGPEQEFIGTCSCNPEVLAKKIVEEKKNFPSKFSETEILKKIKIAYNKVVGKEKGEKAPIIEVLKELAILLQDKKYLVDPVRENYKSYGRINFSYDLYRINKLQDKTLFQFNINLVTASRESTKDRSKYLWVPRNENGDGYVYAYIIFLEGQNGKD